MIIYVPIDGIVQTCKYSLYMYMYVHAVFAQDI